MKKNLFQELLSITSLLSISIFLMLLFILINMEKKDIVLEENDKEIVVKEYHYPIITLERKNEHFFFNVKTDSIIKTYKQKELLYEGMIIQVTSDDKLIISNKKNKKKIKIDILTHKQLIICEKHSLDNVKIFKQYYPKEEIILEF